MKILQWGNSDKENQGMLELIGNGYDNEEIKNLRYFNWQYNENPQGKSIIVLCIDDEKEDLIIGQESIIASELNLDKVKRSQGMGITFVTSAETDEEGLELLRQLGFPFKEMPVNVSAWN